MKDPAKMSQRELRGELREARILLAKGACPNANEGCSDGVVDLYNGTYEVCQWCVRRSELLDAGN